MRDRTPDPRKLKEFRKPEPLKLEWEFYFTVLTLLLLPFVGAVVGTWYAMANNW